ncbi:tyrosine-protein phosphatase non-receptor type 1-like isoform X2 [Synchiropus splendidus]|uniref:tyrosine-protein phosphatase non-receptor type 1-like isoform X2 n=1 Tax=Synchiropus splendidus TaxID=270530 RepID=UPI00237D33E4|nr:tyrosine-protein phosphatase non-receptor type 1-like isoform X2 [Synchiropus splendidus]
METEFQHIDDNGLWSSVYQEIRQQSCDLPCKVARLPENKSRNRYRDVSPFDHSRIRLQQSDNDYINASLISVEEAERRYILTQGPLPNTCGHFWQMVWEQQSVGVVMLNRVIEKGSVKCAQYWPRSLQEDLLFDDVNFKVCLVSEEGDADFSVRLLELHNLTTGTFREILHFHYLTWPDFGVPDSPTSFLNFLFKVRESGCLEKRHGPVVVHCSAGIGRSGTFCLVDTCLLLMSLREEPSSVKILEVLVQMRRCRMGLIQTADQLRFSYLSIIQGAELIVGQSMQECVMQHRPPELAPPPPLPPPRLPHNGTLESLAHPEDSEATAPTELARPTQQPDLRRRPAAAPVDAHSRNSQQNPAEPDSGQEQPRGSWPPPLTNVCVCAALLVSAYVCYRTLLH